MRHTYSVTEPNHSQSLRERKKVQTRLAIRREAFRLFEKYGYNNTTIDQIAHAADVSPRTFYRYFGVKEALLLSDDQISDIVAAFVDASTELKIIDAYRHALTTVFSKLSLDQREDAIAGQRMMYEIPEARGMLYSEYIRLINLITEALTSRPDAPAEESKRRVLAGAIVGVLIGASHQNPMPEAALQAALATLDELLA